MNKNTSSQQYGKLAEDKALEFLQQKNLTLLERNYRTQQGEIDLVMQDQDTLVFVEVRARSNSDFLAAVETIDTGKRRHIIKASEHYLQAHRINSACRLDVITFSGSLEKSKIDWIKNAFEA